MRSENGYVYILQALTGEYKIGKSVNPKKRIGQLQTNLPGVATLVHTIETDQMLWLEQFLHSRFASKKIRGEWFALSDEDITDLKGRVRWDKPHDFPARWELNPKTNDPRRLRRKIGWYGPKLKELREAAGMSQAQLGASVGIAGSQINKLELGVNQPMLSVALAIATALDAEIVDFIPPEELPARKKPRRRKAGEETSG